MSLKNAATGAVAKSANIVTAVKPAPCSTGSPAQKFACGYNRVSVNTTSAANAGNAAHHYLPVIAVAIVVILALIMAARWSRSNVSATR